VTAVSRREPCGRQIDCEGNEQMRMTGDFDYDRHGAGYAAHRRPDPRIAAHIHRALGDARPVLNVGAGAGSYEPVDRQVVAVEPSAVMRSQRPTDALPAIIGVAEALPFDDAAFDAVMAVMMVHQWADLERGSLSTYEGSLRLIVGEPASNG
jgi:SAM-dependent methyltransferase